MVQPANEANTDDRSKLREVSYEYSNNLGQIPKHLGVSLCFSTYQAGKLGVVTVKDNALDLAFHNFGQDLPPISNLGVFSEKRY